MSDGANEHIHIFDRESLTELTAFGDDGRQPSVAVDSKGNLFTTETYRGQRVQKCVYKGIASVASDYTGAPWPKK